jgi:uncharacterized protein (TIGR03437 family)
VVIHSQKILGILLFAGSFAVLNATPRLALSQTALTESTAQGSNGAALSVDAGNKGDGSLNLQVSSSVSWLAPTLGPTHGCDFGNSCIPVNIAVQTASFAKGTYTGFVTVNDPNALDSPQSISVTVRVGGGIPDKIEFFAKPKGTATTEMFGVGQDTTIATTQNGQGWLSVAAEGAGSFQFNMPLAFRVTAAPTDSMGAGDYTGSINVIGAPIDTKTVQVTLHVTTSPILQASPTSVYLRDAPGAVKQTAFVGIGNTGQGTLSLSGITPATTSGGSWLAAQSISNGQFVSITADPTGLSPGTYFGTVAIASNAANATVTIPVQFDVVASGPAVASAGGVVSNATFSGNAVAQGDIVAVFGQQFSYTDPVSASNLPLPVKLGDTQVFVNDQPVPLYFVSYGQVNFQIPYEAAQGDARVRVDRGGQRGNQVFVSIVARQPRMILLNGGPYAIIANQAGQLVGIPSSPSKAGDVVIIYALGLGQTNPPVTSGAAAPGPPNLANAPATQICFGTQGPIGPPPPCINALFSGLTPTFVGLYQINAVLPSDLPAGPNVPMVLMVGGVNSNKVQLATNP